MSDVRVRFAPSPTGELHIGGARTALFNWLYAQKTGGKFILRIDDTDRERSSPDHLEAIYRALTWLGLDWDEGPDQPASYGPYVQSERLSIYTEAAQKLLQEGKAYYCFCSVEELAEQKKIVRESGQAPRYRGTCRNLPPAQQEEKKLTCQGHVIRLLTPEEGETVVEDVIRGWVTFDNANLDDLILIRSDGLPTYNFASVVDDSLMKITHVIRAEEHLSNTPRQQFIARQLGFRLPVYAHVPMILAPDHSKLSKRHGATSVQEYKEMGIVPSALLNYLALLGWSPGEDREILPLEEIVQLFSLERITKNPAIYDQQKLTWMNGHYLRTMELEELLQEALPFFQAAGVISANPTEEERLYLQAVLRIMRDRIKVLGEAVEATDYFFREDYAFDPEGVKKQFQQNKETGKILTRVSRVLQGLEAFEETAVHDALAGVAVELEVSQGKVNVPLRLALTGRTRGPELLDILLVLGKDRSVARIEKTLERFDLG